MYHYDFETQYRLFTGISDDLHRQRNLAVEPRRHLRWSSLLAALRIRVERIFLPGRKAPTA